MNPKYRYPVVLFLASFLLLILGMLFKIQHWPYGYIISGAGMLVQMFSILWLIVALLRKQH